jgi:hypothetical protein
MLGFYHLDMAYDEVLAARVRDSLRDIAWARRYVASLPPK